MAARIFGGAATLLALSGCSEGVLAAYGPIAAEERQLLLEALTCMLIVVVPVIVLTLVFAWWFRASHRAAAYKPTWSYSGRIEFSIWIIPILVILFIASLAWSGSHELDPYQPIASNQAPLEVDVVSLGWKWLFIYPEQKMATVNELAVPAGRPIQFKPTSATVMNSFFIPGIAGQIYTMAGMQTRLAVVINDPGTYRGLSSEFSGDGFSDMHFPVLAMDGGKFDKWVDQVQANASSVMNNDAFDALVRNRSVQGKTYYSMTQGDVFEHALGINDTHQDMPSMSGVAASNSQAKDRP